MQAAGLTTPTDGWALTAGGLYLTADGGLTWRAGVVPGPKGGRGILGIGFVDPLDGWLATLDATDPYSTVFDAWRTTDGARTWSKAVLPEGANRSDTMGPVQFAILDRDHVFLWVEGGMPNGYTSDLYESDDGGRSWSPDRVAAGPGITGDIAFADLLHGVVSGGAPGSRLFRTSDGGRTWGLVSYPSPPGTLTEAGRVGTATFWDASDGILPLVSGTMEKDTTLSLLRTSDAGATWSVADAVTLSPTQPGGALVVLGANEWLLVDIANVWSSFDAGRTWAHSPSVGLPASPWQPVFVDAQHGWAQVFLSVCMRFKTDCQSRSGLYATSDGGRTWHPLWPR